MYTYKINLTPDDNDTVMATSPDFPELTTFGDDADDALLRAVDALEEAIAARISAREDLPAPSRGKHSVALPTLTAMKVMLYISMREQNVTKAELTRQLSCHAPQVDRLLDLRHSSKVDQLESAMKAIGKTFDVRVV